MPIDQSSAGGCLSAHFQSALLTEITALSKCFCQLLCTDRSLQIVSKFTPETTFNFVCTTDQRSLLIPWWATLHKTKQTSPAFFHVASVLYKVFPSRQQVEVSVAAESTTDTQHPYTKYSQGVGAQDLLLLSHLGATRKLGARMCFIERCHFKGR